jgi:hypothetical protein
MNQCSGCGNPSRGRRHTIYVVRTVRSNNRLVRVRACSTCFAQCVHLLIAAPLQLAKTRSPRGSS